VTPDMSFECLLVSRDAGVTSVLKAWLDNLSISTNICSNSSMAFDQFTKGNPELVILDWEDDSPEFVSKARKAQGWREPTLVVISPNDSLVPGADLFLCRPVTSESSAKALKAAYSRILYRYRRRTRYPLISTVRTTDENNHSADVTVTNIGDGGLRLSARQEFIVGNRLSFRLLLPGTDKPVQIQTRVRWTRTYGTVGCEFLHIPAPDLHVLHDWLIEKDQFRKPVTPI
jgi:DNA-binding response OmpR family regulator